MDSLGTMALFISPCSFRESTRGNNIELVFTFPSSPSSPKTKRPSSSIVTLCKAIRSAMERSICVPFFLISLGLKLTVIFRGGKINSLVSSADFVRSFASCMSEEAKPTTAKPGKPLVKVASTSMTFAFTPSSVAQVSLLTIIFCLGFCFTLILCVFTLCVFGGVPLLFFAFIVTVWHSFDTWVKNMSY